MPKRAERQAEGYTKKEVESYWDQVSAFCSRVRASAERTELQQDSS